MQTSNKILDDLAKVANGAVATMTGIKDEVEAMVRQQVERFLADGNLVPRDEFDAMAEVARNARAIYLQSGVSHAMPPANITWMEPEDRAAIRRWYRAAEG